MAIDPKHIRRVLDAFEAEDWDEIHLVTSDTEVHLIAASDEHQDAQTSHALPASSDPAANGEPPSTAGGSGPPPASDGLKHVPPVGHAAAASGPPTPRAGTHTVTAPTPGLFWQAPSPGAPPFTELGEHIEQGAALCIVELMKLMNTIPATVTGIVVEICARNGEQVGAGQPLFRIAPEER